MPECLNEMKGQLPHIAQVSPEAKTHFHVLWIKSNTLMNKYIAEDSNYIATNL